MISNLRFFQGVGLGISGTLFVVYSKYKNEHYDRLSYGSCIEEILLANAEGRSRVTFNELSKRNVEKLDSTLSAANQYPRLHPDNDQRTRYEFQRTKISPKNIHERMFKRSEYSMVVSVIRSDSENTLRS